MNQWVLSRVDKKGGRVLNYSTNYTTALCSSHVITGQLKLKLECSRVNYGLHECHCQAGCGLYEYDYQTARARSMLLLLLG